MNTSSDNGNSKPEADNDLHQDEYVSKTRRKQEMQERQALGEQLTQLARQQLLRMDLPDDLLEAVLAAQAITSHGAHKRQLQYIGKLMRNIDPDPIRRQLTDVQLQSAAATRQLHHIEGWRDRLLNEGDAALSELLQAYPGIDTQQLRQLVRNAIKEKRNNAPPKSARAIFKLLRETMET